MVLWKKEFNAPSFTGKYRLLLPYQSHNLYLLMQIDIM